MPAYAHQQAAVIANKSIGQSITSQKYARSALLTLLLGITGGEGNVVDIGRPNENIILGGMPISASKREEIRGKVEFTQRIQGFKTSNTAVIGLQGAMPSVANPQTSTQDLATMNDASFRYMANLITPLQVWNSYLSIAMANADSDNGVAASVLTEESTAIALNEHYDNLNSRILYGAPTNQDAQTWNDIPGIISALTANNRYGMIDRTLLTSDNPWNPQTVASGPADITALIDNANVTLGCNVFGGGVMAILCGAANYLNFKNQAIARDRGGYVIKDPEADGLPGLAKYGITREIVKCNNAYIIHEPFLDTCYATVAGSTTPLYTAQPNYCLALNLNYWRFITHPQYTMKVGPFVDISDKSIGALDLTQSFIKTWATLICERPNVQVLYQAVA